MNGVKRMEITVAAEEVVSQKSARKFCILLNERVKDERIKGLKTDFGREHGIFQSCQTCFIDSLGNNRAGRSQTL